MTGDPTELCPVSGRIGRRSAMQTACDRAQKALFGRVKEVMPKVGLPTRSAARRAFSLAFSITHRDAILPMPTADSVRRNWSGDRCGAR